MRVEKIIFVVPGYRQKPEQKAYRAIAKLLVQEGYFPLVMPILWRNTTIIDNTQDLIAKYKSIQAKRKYILGFSYGAMIAFVASTRIRPDGLILCSLSPYFKEDLQKKSFASFVTGFRYREFATLESKKLAKQIKAKQIHMLYGTKEPQSLITRVTETFDHISSKKKLLISVEKTDHEIGSKKYLASIKHVVQLLR